MSKGYSEFVRFGVYVVDGEEYKIRSYNAVNGRYTLTNVKDKNEYEIFSITYLEHEIRHLRKQEFHHNEMQSRNLRLVGTGTMPE